MSSITETTCPKCGHYAEYHEDDGIYYCQKEITRTLSPGANPIYGWSTRGGGCGAMTTYREATGRNWEPSNSRGT